MRLRARVDANHSKIVAALRAAGCSVFDTSRVGGGFPDLVVGRRQETYLIEVKTDAGKLTPDQKQFLSSWRGGVLLVVYSVEDALNAVGAMLPETP